MKRLFFPLIVLIALPMLLFAKDYKVVTYTTEHAGIIYFEHDLHLSALGNNCTTCHNSLFSVVRKKEPTTMAEMEKGKSCGACHNGKRAFPLAECLRCHKVGDIPMVIPDFGTLQFPHKLHISLYGCTDCHSSIFKPKKGGNVNKSMGEMERGESCGACHDGKTAFTVKENCTRCHAVKEIPYSADAQFSHKLHLDLSYGCRDCHSKFFIAGPNSKRYTMQAMEQGRSCGGCHNGNTAFSVKGSCGVCHKNVKEVVFKQTDALFSHKLHTPILNCDSCHPRLFVGGVNSTRSTMKEMEKGNSCGVCHDNSIVFGVEGYCNKCHVKVKDVGFATEGAGLVTFKHDIHTGMYPCDNCHNKIFTAGASAKRYKMADMDKGQSCGACHNGTLAFRANEAANCGKCHPLKDVSFRTDARFSHVKHLQMLTCTDCHNGVFKPGPGNVRRTMAEMEKGQSCGVCHDGKTAFGVAGSCDKCHPTTVDVPINVPQAGVTTFSHKIHAGMYKCDDCHNALFKAGAAAKRVTMARMEKGESCGACHDGKTAFTVKENCQKCHPVKEIAFKESAALFSHTFHTSAYRCDDCHDKLFKPGAGNKRFTMADMEKGQSCGACHDGKTAFASDGSCDKCHKRTKAVLYEVPTSSGNVTFSHKLHSEKGYGCIDCHNKVIKAGTQRKSFSMKEMEQGKSCGACHGFSMAFAVKDPANCERCHIRPGW